jgi:hypothetical protein
MTPEFRPEQLNAATEAGSRFWQALADNDDEALKSVLGANVLEILGHGPLRARSAHQVGNPLTPPGLAIAARIREHIGYERADCARMGLSTVVGVLSPTAIRLFYTPTDTVIHFDAGATLAGRFLELDLDEGRWLVDPIRAHDRPEIATLSLDLG